MSETEKPSAREINATIRYTLWSVYRRSVPLTGSVLDASRELEDLLTSAEAEDITLRGIYDVSALRADADLMLWFHAPTAELLQKTLRSFRQTKIGQSVELVWSSMGIHRPAEFNKSHVPSFMAGVKAREWVCVYPFVRSYDWYLISDEERRAMLSEHGIMGREYPQVITNTVSSFALGDYEWLLALESDLLHDIVDMMRHLRGSQTRRHIRVETPFYTGRRIDPTEVAQTLR